MTLYSLALEMLALLAVWQCLGAWQWDSATPGRRVFISLALASALWCVGELSAERELLGDLACQRIAYLGALALPPLWLGVSAHAARLEMARRAPWFAGLLLAPQLVIYALLYAGPWSHLFLSPPDANGHSVSGPLWWVNLVYSAALVAAGASVLVISALRHRDTGRWDLRLLAGIASLVPLAGLVAPPLGLAPSTPHLPPLLFGAALLALRGAVSAGGLMQALPISQHDLIRQLPLGVILTDPRGVVLDVNPAAERQLGIPARTALGRTLDGVLDEVGDELLIEVTSVSSGKRETGQIVLIDPPHKL
jgi:PAS domain-containing protein